MIAKEAMLAAHVEFELRRYSPAQLPALLHEETTALYAWLATVKVGEIVQAHALSAWVQRCVIEQPLPAAVVDFMRENSVVAFELIQDDQSRVADLLPKEVYDRAVAWLASHGETRRQLLHQVVRSSVYSRLIANVLYHGIKSFLLTENGMARAIPGAASMLRLSQSALNAAAPQMEKSIDKQLVAFIDENIQQTIADSEAFLNRSLDETLLQRVGDEVWESLGHETLARLTRSVEKDAVAEGNDVLQEAWQHLRTAPIVQDIVQAVVRSFFLQYGKQDAAALLAALGLDASAVEQQLLTVAAPLVEQARTSGYLEQRIRRQLEPFYAEYFAGQPAEQPAGRSTGQPAKLLAEPPAEPPAEPAAGADEKAAAPGATRRRAPRPPDA